MNVHERDARFVETFLSRVGEVWRDQPDWRFGQFVSNVVGLFPDSVDEGPGVGGISDEGFLRALDLEEVARRKGREEFGRVRREGRGDPVDPKISEGVKRTQRMFDRWALEKFGRIGRDPARIDPFLHVLGQEWLKRPHLRFGQLVVGVLTRGADPGEADRDLRSGLRGIEDDGFLKLLEQWEVDRHD